MAHAVELFFARSADAEIRALWRRLEDAGVPSTASQTHGRHDPHVTLAVASSIPDHAREALGAEVRALAIPDLWLYTLGTFPSEDAVLLLSAVVDTEVLAVHSAVHDVLAGKVTGPSAYYLPGAWIPHCTLSQGITREQLSKGFAALHPLEPVRAPISSVGVTDTRTGDVALLT